MEHINGTGQRPKSHKGGYRPGSGRPKGSPNKAPFDRLHRVLIEGHTPLEVMLSNMRRYYKAALAKEEQHDCIADDLRQAAQHCAVQAAPYVHSRHTHAVVRHELAVTELTDDELAMIAAGNRDSSKTIEHQPVQQPTQKPMSALEWVASRVAKGS